MLKRSFISSSNTPYSQKQRKVEEYINLQSIQLTKSTNLQLSKLLFYNFLLFIRKSINPFTYIFSGYIFFFFLLDMINISFNLSGDSKCNLAVYNMDNGMRLYEQSLGQLTAGDHLYRINLNVPPGRYLIKLTYSDKVSSSVIMKN